MAELLIGNNLRRLRFDHGEMTQDALARAAGVTRQTIISLEAGRYAPSPTGGVRQKKTSSTGRSNTSASRMANSSEGA